MGWMIMAMLVAATQPRELGQVAFARDFAAAKAESAKSGKPLFVLFDEVPGCGNCTSFGDAVLSDAIIVSAIEDNFVAVAIYNNQGGADRATLQHFGEPAWNNPVVRLLDADENALAPRIADTYTTGPVARTMVAALQKAERPVPAYLLTVAQRSERYEPMYLATPCFWSGEACLGTLPRVASTRVGYVGANEVVEVQPAEGFSRDDIIADAREAGCSVDEVRGRFEFSPRDDKYALRDGRFARLHLTAEQATRVNSAVAYRLDPRIYLTPAQRRLLDSKNR